MLQHFTYRTPTSNTTDTDDHPHSEGQLIAYSPDISPAMATAIIRHVPLTAQSDHARHFALVNWFSNEDEDDQFAFVLASARIEGDTGLAYHCVLMPHEVVAAMHGHWSALLTLVDASHPVTAPDGDLLAPLPIPGHATRDDEFDSPLNQLYATMPDHDMRFAFYLLAAALDARGVMIRNFPADAHQRLQLVEGLTALLPVRYRHHMSFSTFTAVVPPQHPTIIFSNAEDDGQRLIIDWQNPEIDFALLAEKTYAAHLLNLWDNYIQQVPAPDGLQAANGRNGHLSPDASSPDNLDAHPEKKIAPDDMPDAVDDIPQADATALITLKNFLQEVDQAMTIIAERLISGEVAMSSLNRVATRHYYDTAVRYQRDVAIEALLNILQSDNPPQADLYIAYMRQLLHEVLAERHTEAAQFVAHSMDENDELDAALSEQLEQELHDQPDAVYVFVRSRLTEGADEKWVSRLRAAATHSLDVALTSGDAATLASWLRLISREPSRYQLGEILRNGVLAASDRAAEHEELAQELLIIAIKRNPDLLQPLLNNQALMETLTPQVSAALREFDSTALEDLSTQSRELFLLAIDRAVSMQELCITPAVIRALWELYGKSSAALSEPFKPYNVIMRLVRDGVASMTDSALELLLTQVLATGEDALFYEIANTLGQQDFLRTVLPQALEQCGRDDDDVLELISQLMADGILTPQEVADTYGMMLVDRDWSSESNALIEQLARLINQYNDVTVSVGVLWKLLETASEARSEAMTRGIVRRLVHELSDMALETQLIAHLQRLRRSITWSNSARNIVLNWWRSYTSSLSVGQLQKLDRALEGEGKRTLDDLRDVVHTHIALRRMMGQRSLTEFAQEINIAYTILQAIADGFDPSGKGAAKSNPSVDIQTIRDALLTWRESDELTPDAQQVLATNLKELAQLITSLADNRSRASFIRSDDTVERQLVSGEQQPQSAVDIMKWLSGYLDGSQADDE